MVQTESPIATTHSHDNIIFVDNLDGSLLLDNNYISIYARICVCYAVTNNGITSRGRDAVSLSTTIGTVSAAAK